MYPITRYVKQANNFIISKTLNFCLVTTKPGEAESNIILTYTFICYIFHQIKVSSELASSQKELQSTDRTELYFYQARMWKTR